MLEMIIALLTLYGFPIVLACLYSYHLDEKAEKEKSNELIQKENPKD